MPATNDAADEEGFSTATVETDDSDVERTHSAAEDPIRSVGPWRTVRVVAKRVLVFGILPGLALALGSGAGWLKWRDGSIRDAQTARTQSVRAATESTVAMLSYQPDSVDNELNLARDRLTGSFRAAYESLIKDVVIPGAKQKQISAKATVPAAASVSANDHHAVVLVFVDQTTVIGDDPPTQTASSVKVTLDKVRNQWLISDFTPI